MILLDKGATILTGGKNRNSKPQSQGIIKCMITISLSTACKKTKEGEIKSTNTTLLTRKW